MTEQFSDRKAARKLICLSALGVFLIGVSLTELLPKKLVWNASTSIPIGFYLIRDSAPKRNDIVLVRLPDWVTLIAGQRGYLPRKIPALKRVSALAGDRVCRFGGMIIVNGKASAKARLFDNLGRRMPYWHGCVTLNTKQVLLLADHPNSFDGRYIGVTETADIMGVALPLWVHVK